MQALSDQVNSVSNLIKKQGYVSTLTSYQTKETRLLTKVNSLISNTDVQQFVAASTSDQKDLKAKLEGFNEFYDIFRKYGIFKINRSNLTESQLETFIGYYNKFKSAFEQYSHRKDDSQQDPYRTVCSAAFGSNDTDLINFSVLYELSYSWMMCKLHNLTLSNIDSDPNDSYNRQFKPALYFIADVEKAYDIRSKNGEINLNQTSVENNSYKDVFVSAVDKLGGTTFVADVMEVGSLLLSSGAGTETGVLEGFFSVVNSIYNFESQTTELKKSFLTKAEYIYDTTAAFAYTYCQATGDTANATAIKSQLYSVNKLFTKMWDLISEAETRAAAGTDILLVTNQKVSKDMLSVDVTSNKKFNSWVGKGALEISLTDLNEMATRASNRGISLAQDLINAGFKNVTANKAATKDSAAQYVYLTKTTQYSYKSYAALKGIAKQIFGSKWVETFTSYASTDVLEQTGLTVKTNQNSVVLQEHMYEKIWTTGSHIKFELEYDYNYVLAFKAP
jgi:hypothetical protein